MGRLKLITGLSLDLARLEHPPKVPPNPQAAKGQIGFPVALCDL
jgi:hypothetical protein